MGCSSSQTRTRKEAMNLIQTLKPDYDFTHLVILFFTKFVMMVLGYLSPSQVFVKTTTFSSAETLWGLFCISQRSLVELWLSLNLSPIFPECLNVTSNNGICNLNYAAAHPHHIIYTGNGTSFLLKVMTEDFIVLLRSLEETTLYEIELFCETLFMYWKMIASADVT